MSESSVDSATISQMLAGFLQIHNMHSCEVFDSLILYFTQIRDQFDDFDRKDKLLLSALTLERHASKSAVKNVQRMTNKLYKQSLTILVMNLKCKCSIPLSTTSYVKCTTEEQHFLSHLSY